MRTILFALGLLAASTVAYAQSDEWFLGSHPNYHAAMVREIDGVFIAIYAAKEPTIYGSPLLMETMAPACDTKRPISMHATQAIEAFGSSAEDRLKVVRATVQSFYDINVKPCPPAEGFNSKLFHRFDDAYLAMDAMLIEAEVLPLNPEENLRIDAPEGEQQDSFE